MTGTQYIERQIVRRILGNEAPPVGTESASQWSERLIAILTLTAGLLVVGTIIEELLWVLLGAATLFTLR